MLLEVLPGLLVMIGMVGWSITAVCAFLLATRHGRPDRKALWYAANGWAFYSRENFAPSGAGLHRLLSIGMFVFVLSMAAGITTAAIGASLQ